jgi:pyridoxamine 5'-phosphate oxidase-like protein
MSNGISNLEDLEAQELLRTAALLRLAYAGHDGMPRAIPIGFFWDGERVVVCTATNAPKVKALAERPNVAVTIDAGTTPSDAKQLLIRGTATVEVVDGVPSEYISGAKKVMGGAELEEFETAVEGMYEQMARISITPEWVRFYDFGAGKLPPFLRKLAEGDQR